MKFLKGFLTLGCIALHTVACATVPVQINPAQATLAIQEGDYDVEKRNSDYCSDITLAWDVQRLQLGEVVVFLNVNGAPIVEENQYEQGCTFTTQAKTENGVLTQVENEKCPAFEVTNISQVAPGPKGRVLFTKTTTEVKGPSTRPVQNIKCQFKPAR